MQTLGPAGMRAESRKQRRAAVACIACRQSKIKCSGEEPCANCQRRSLSCHFSAENNKVLVSERYLRELQKQAHNSKRAAGTKRPRDFAFTPEDDENEGNANNVWASSEVGGRADESLASPASDFTLNIWTSPFALPSTVIKDTHTEQRNWIWLAPTSAWSLTARLIVMMTEKLDVNPARTSIKFYLDGDIYPFSWNRVSANGTPDMTGLPSLDYSLYLFNIVKFHLGQTYRLIDEDAFVSHAKEFYGSHADERAIEHRFWFVQFLLVLALGSAFLSRPRNQTGPPGAKYFARAMSAMPNHTCTGKDSLVAMVALALAGVYLYAIDHREAAHVHLGHAMRIAQLEGLHTQLPDQELGTATVAQCRNIWWSLYIMDRHVSSSLGLPMTIQDSDITALINIPSTNPRDIRFSLQVGLMQMLSFILSTIYKTEKTQLGAFLEITKNILQTMASHAEEIEKMIHVDFHGSMENVPQETRHIILLYHQCVIIATRPLLLSVLKERLEKLGHAEEDWQKFLALPKSLISIGIRSAFKTLQILSDENGLLETFLPFDLEFAYAASLHLAMANTLFPASMDDPTYSQIAYSILDEMISNGNKVAEARKAELRCIESLFQGLAKRVKQEGLRVLTLSGGGDEEFGFGNTTRGECQGRVSTSEPETASQSLGGEIPQLATEPSVPANVDSLDLIGISSYEFLSIVNQIDNPELASTVLGEGSEWLEGRNMIDLFD